MAGKAPQIVDNAAHPNFYAGRIVSTGFDGAAVLVTFGNVRAGLSGRPDDAKVHVTAALLAGASALLGALIMLSV